MRKSTASLRKTLRITGPEQRRCPPEFQDRITRMFGRSKFGDPLFKVAWGQSEFHKVGNRWRDKHGTERCGYRQRYLCDGSPCWNILRLKSAEHWGTPELWYYQTWDDASKTYTLGEYPWRGRYETLFALNRKEIVDGELKVIAFPLSHVIIDQMIPLILATQRMTEEEKRAAQQLVRHRQEQEENAEITERMMNDLPAYYGPVSFSRQGIKTSLLDRKMHAIQAAWNRLSRSGQRPRFQKGFFQGEQPRTIN
jgi:hypothetical protein